MSTEHEKFVKLLKWAREFFQLTLKYKKSFILEALDIKIDELAPILTECKDVDIIDPQENIKLFIKGMVWGKESDDTPFYKRSLIQSLQSTGVCRDMEETTMMKKVIQQCIDEGIILEASNGMLGVPKKVNGSIGFD